MKRILAYIVAAVAGLIAVINGALNLAIANGDPGTGNGVVGAAAPRLGRQPLIQACDMQGLAGACGAAPDCRTELAEDLSIALFLILDQLSPLERAVFLLHDVFDFSFSEIATGLGWREDFASRVASVNGLPGFIVDAPEGSVQTAAFEIDGDVIQTIYVVRNPDKLRHLRR